MIFFTACQTSHPEEVVNGIRIAGSESIMKAFEGMQENIRKQTDTVSIIVEGGGSLSGLAALEEGRVDMAISSMVIPDSIRRNIEESGLNVIERILGYDALVVVTNIENPITQLKAEQIKQIYNGDIQAWESLGWSDIPVVPLSRDRNSGTRVLFRDAFFEKDDAGINSVVMGHNDNLINRIEDDRGALGYVAVSYVNNSVNAVEISMDSGRSYIEPSYFNIINEQYPLTRPVYFYYLARDTPELKNLIDYIRSPDGRVFLMSAGIIPYETMN